MRNRTFALSVSRQENLQQTAECLAKRSIMTEHAPDLATAALRLADASYDALILDLGQPDGDGGDWLNTLSDDRPPVLILIARGALAERVLGLDSGADDYLVKPAEVDEIAAGRARAILSSWPRTAFLSIPSTVK